MSKIIQRYFDVPKFISLIQTRKIFLAKMSSFDDALEGGLTLTNFFDISNEHEYLSAAVNLNWPSTSLNKEEKQSLDEDKKAFTEKINKRTFMTPFGPYSCRNGEKLYPLCREWIYVSCWHQSDHECAAMWKLYGVNKNAVCIFSSKEKLLASVDYNCSIDNLKHCSIDNLKLRAVNYISHIRDQFGKDPLEPFLSKSKPYSFEKEVRLIGWNSETNLERDTPINSGLLLNIDLQSAIERIIISPYADSWFTSVVEKVCLEAQLNVSIEESLLKVNPVTSLGDVMALAKKYGLIKC